MSATKKVLITGAAGQVGGVGSKVVQTLRQRGHAVRAMVRRADQRADRLAALGAEIVVGDLTDLSDVHTALRGVDRVYFGMSVSPQYLEATANFAAVAKSHDIEFLVNMSQMTVSQMSITETTSSPQHKLHWLSEQVLNWSGIPVVHVRPTVFLDNPLFTSLASRGIAIDGTIRLPFGDARTAPVATQDVAQVVAHLLERPDGHAGKVYELTGPRSQSMAEIAAEYSLALGREVRYVNADLADWRERVLLPLSLPDHIVAHVITMAQLHRDGRYDRSSRDFESLTGASATSVSEWVRSRRDEFP